MDSGIQPMKIDDAFVNLMIFYRLLFEWQTCACSIWHVYMAYENVIYDYIEMVLKYLHHFVSSRFISACISLQLNWVKLSNSSDYIKF